MSHTPPTVDHARVTVMTFTSPPSLTPHYSSFPTSTHIDLVISFASKVVALMNVLVQWEGVIVRR
jgi:hypothetical protein